jgi:hypothetical protein
MKYLPILITFIGFSCTNETSSFTQKSHEVIKSEIVANYQQNRQIFQSLANEVSTFKILRAIQFKYGRNGSDGINVYCDSIYRNGKGYSFVISNPDDLRLQKVLDKEGITKVTIESIKQRLGQINCSSFFSVRQSDINAGTSYIHVEFKYNDWNGANFYFYKLFDKKMESKMIDFFDRRSVVMGQINSTGEILDSNAVWYLPTD